MSGFFSIHFAIIGLKPGYLSLYRGLCCVRVRFIRIAQYQGQLGFLA